METRVRSLVLVALGFAMAVLFTNMQSPAVAQAPAPAAGAGDAQIKELQRQVRYLYSEVSSIRAEMRKAAAGGGDAKKADKKIEELTKKLENHTHDVLQEGRAADGSLKQVDQAEFSRAGLNSTGAYRVGKAKF
jgi:peptidoglycan hydrolase CwlO-like protein